MTHRDDIKRANKANTTRNKGGLATRRDSKHLEEDIKEILEDAKDGRVKKATQKKIKDILDE